MTNDKEPGWAKINISQSTEQLVKHGPSLSIGIAPLPFMGTGMTTVVAQIDTGAERTAISPRIAASLALQSIGDGKIQEAGREPIIALVFHVRLFLPKNTEIDLDVTGLPAISPPHDVLIGRDVLANCRLGIDFVAGTAWLHIKSDS